MSTVLLVIGVVVGCVGVAAPAGAARGAAAPSDGDCEILLGAEANSGSSSASELDNLASQADDLGEAAGDLSDRKLKKALVGLAAVYREASKAKNVAGAGIVMAKQSKKYGKAFGVYAKALTLCSVKNVPSGSTR